MSVRIDPSSAGLDPGLSILVIEDDENDYLLTLAELGRAGVQCESLRVDEMSDYLDALHSRSWHLVLADYNVPGLDVFQALHELKRMLPDCPFILLSGMVEEALGAEFVTQGACEVIHKENLVRLPQVVVSLLNEVNAPVASHVSHPHVDAQERGASSVSPSPIHESHPPLTECAWVFDPAQSKVVWLSPSCEDVIGENYSGLLENPCAWLSSAHPSELLGLRFSHDEWCRPGLNLYFRAADKSVGEVTANSLRQLHLRSLALNQAMGAESAILFLLSDITEWAVQRQEMEKHELIDASTGFPNRTQIRQQLPAQISLARRNEWKVGVGVLGVQRFTQLFDALGFNGVELLMKRLGQRMQEHLRDSDLFGRLSQEAFIFSLQGLRDSHDCHVVATKLVNAVSQVLEVDGQAIFPHVSVGLSLFPDDAGTVDDLLGTAEAAMVRSREGVSGHIEFFTPLMNQRARERVGLESALHLALDRQQFELHYQPKISCYSGKITGFEALIRWNHPERGRIPPVAFIPLLEETGLIVQVGAWVVDEACRQTSEWQGKGWGKPSIAVNVSGVQMQHDDDLVGHVERVLLRTGLPAACLELELTESVLMHDIERSRQIITRLKTLGVSLSIDDFGTGYSSLSYLRQLPIDALKVDRSFVKDIDTDAEGAVLTQAIITLAHQLRMQVIAEGVETADQLKILVGQNCGHMQGFFFSRPVTAEEAGNMLRQQLERPLFPMWSPDSKSPLEM